MVIRALSILAFLFPLLGQAQSPFASDPSFRPSEGIWWSSEQPGTGVAFNMDSEGRWFAAIYLYGEDGRPTFLTMQGEALAYGALDRPPEDTWAIAASPLILSEGGQCLLCPWSPAVTSDTGQDAEIHFHGRNLASLRVGAWELELMLLPVPALPYPLDPPHEIVQLPLDRDYLITTTLEADGLSHFAVARHQRAAGFTAQVNGRFACIDCRTLNAEGNPDPTLDQLLREKVENIYSSCLGRCRMHIAGTANVELFVDKTRTRFSGFERRGMGPDEPARVIRFQLLEENWRPALR